MKKILLYLALTFCVFNANAQSCEELLKYVKAESYGSAYSSYSSDAISKVTFYDVVIDYQYYYFAVVCFKRKYSYSCDEYIYQVDSNTKSKYSMNYFSSAGKAFWKYIEPYSGNLNCGPDFD
mgnify:CR=1 FL=1